MSRPLPESIQWWLDTMLPNVIDSPKQREYLEDPVRLREGEAVDPCVQRFADYEFDPPEGKGVGRGRGVIVAPLAQELRKALADVDASGREALRRSVIDCLAIGYMTLAWYQAGRGEPPNPEPGVDPRELWERWTVRQGTARKAHKKAQLDELETMAWKMAEGQFAADLQKHGAYRLRDKGNIGQLGIFYGRAGMLLRLFQSTSEFDLEPHKSQREAAGLWPFERPSGAVA